MMKEMKAIALTTQAKVDTLQLSMDQALGMLRACAGWDGQRVGAPVPFLAAHREGDVELVCAPAQHRHLVPNHALGLGVVEGL